MGQERLLGIDERFLSDGDRDNLGRGTWSGGVGVES